MIDSLADRLLNGDRAALAKAITRVESTRKDHQNEAVRILDAVMPYTGKADRIGLTGVPGVGKSTMIDALGLNGECLAITGQFRPGDIRFAVADISAAERALGWTPKVSLKDGLATLVAWARETQ